MRNDSQIFTLYDSTFKKLIYSTQLDYRSFISFMMEFREIIYQKIHKELYPKHLKDKNVEIQIRMLCQYVSEKIYPNFCRIRDKYLKNNEVEETIVDIFDRLEDDLFAIISCRSLKHFALYIDRDKNYEDLVWEKGTLRIFENYFFYANSMILKNNIDLIQASYFPGAGKSYAGDLTTAYWLGYNPNMSFLRITYNDDLTKSFIKGTADIIKSERFKKVWSQVIQSK